MLLLQLDAPPPPVPSSWRHRFHTCQDPVYMPYVQHVQHAQYVRVVHETYGAETQRASAVARGQQFYPSAAVFTKERVVGAMRGFNNIGGDRGVYRSACEPFNNRGWGCSPLKLHDVLYMKVSPPSGFARDLSL